MKAYFFLILIRQELGKGGDGAHIIAILRGQINFGFLRCCRLNVGGEQ